MPLDRLLASLDPHGKGFERLCKWLLCNGPEYRLQLKHVWLWDEWPGRWGPDAGIDLVAENHEGERWAVQAKHYSPEYAVKKQDIDSFLTESARSEFTYRLLIATTDHVGPTARRTLAAQEKPAGMLLRSQLDGLDVEWPTSLERLRPARPKRKKPRAHQRRAIRDCAEGLASADRGQLVMACGTGKTLVGPFLAESLAARRVLVLVPSLSLLGQTLREWATAVEFDYLAVCSDETVTKDEQDAVVASTSELGIPVTTDPERIARFLRRRGNEMKVVLATYQSSAQIAAAQANRVPAFDLVIADEAHRCAGPQAGVFATVLDATKIKARKRLFMTATPRYFTGRVKREAKEADWEIASMDDEDKFGTVLHRLTFAQAIDRDLLSDYQVVVVGVTDSEARELAERGAFVTRDGKTVTDARTLARQIGLLRAMAEHDLQRVITFHSRIDSSNRFASSLLDTNDWLPARRRPRGTFWTDHVSGKMTAGERDVRLRRLRDVAGDERGVLTNARCLTEGVDVPTLDGVAFIDPRRSQVDVVQAVGRAIRKAEDKTVGTIVIPVFVGEDADPEEALESGEFDRVWQIVKALRDHDEDLAEELDTLRRELGRHHSVGKRPSRIVLDLPVSIGDVFARAFDTRLVERATTSWQQGLGVAQAYHGDHGHLRVPRKYVTPDGFKLGTWLDNRRRDRRIGRLSPERIAALDTIDMIWDQREYDWQLGLAAARAFYVEHGHLRAPRSLAPAGFPLGLWLQTRRGEKRRAELTPERKAELDAIGMIWDPFGDDWRRGVGAARTYLKRHGDLRVSQEYRAPNGFRLGGWIQARRMDRRRGHLSAGRIAELDELGMLWEPHEDAWQRGLAALRTFRAEHGHLRISKKHVTRDGFTLGSWLDNRRLEYRAGGLSQERIEALDALGILWDPWEFDWEQGLAAASHYYAQHGHLRAPRSYSTADGFKLGRWLEGRRRDWRKGTLSPERRSELDALGMAWRQPEDEDWKRGMDAARSYQEAHGHLRVPRSFMAGDGFRLGGWLNNRRTQKRRGDLPEHRITELDALGVDWTPLEEGWERAVDAIRGYVKANGHLRAPRKYVTPDGFRLGLWLNTCRFRRRQGKLSEHRIAELDALGMVWNPYQEDWQRGLEAASVYRKTHAHLRVPKDYVSATDAFRLGGWISNRRIDQRRGKLTRERIADLDALGMVWEPRQL